MKEHEWQARVVQRVKDAHDPPPQTNKRRKERGDLAYASVFGRRLARTQMMLAPEFVNLLDRACRLRNVNQSSYVRRALAVQISADLLIDIAEVLVHSPGQGRYGRMQDRPGSADDGVGIQTWCPHPGCDGSHLSQAGGT